MLLIYYVIHSENGTSTRSEVYDCCVPTNCNHMEDWEKRAVFERKNAARDFGHHFNALVKDVTTARSPEWAYRVLRDIRILQDDQRDRLKAIMLETTDADLARLALKDIGDLTPKEQVCLKKLLHTPA